MRECFSQNFLRSVCIFSRSGADLSTTGAEVACATQWRVNRPKATNCCSLPACRQFHASSPLDCHQEGLPHIVFGGRDRPIKRVEKKEREREGESVRVCTERRTRGGR